MKNLLPNTEADRITLKNEKEAFLKGNPWKRISSVPSPPWIVNSISGDNRAFSYPGAEHKAWQENLKDYVVVHVEFYQKWSDKAEAVHHSGAPENAAGTSW